MGDPAVTETADPVTLEAWSIMALPVYVVSAVTKFRAVLVTLIGASKPNTVIVTVEEEVVMGAKVLIVTVPEDKLQVTSPPVVAAVSPVTEQPVHKVAGLFQFELSNVITIVPPVGISCCNVKLTV